MKRWRVEIYSVRGEERCLLAVHFCDSASPEMARSLALSEHWDEERTRLGEEPVLRVEEVPEETAMSETAGRKRPELFEQLFDLPRRIHEAELCCLEAEERVRAAREALADREGYLLLEAKIEGKNEGIREAHKRELTAEERGRLAEAERALAAAKLVLHLRQNEFQAIRAVVRLLAGEVR